MQLSELLDGCVKTRVAEKISEEFLGKYEIFIRPLLNKEIKSYLFDTLWTKKQQVPSRRYSPPKGQPSPPKISKKLNPQKIYHLKILQPCNIRGRGGSYPAFGGSKHIQLNRYVWKQPSTVIIRKSYILLEKDLCLCSTSQIDLLQMKVISFQVLTIVTVSYILASLEKKTKLGTWSLCTFFCFKVCDFEI